MPPEYSDSSEDDSDSDCMYDVITLQKEFILCMYSVGAVTLWWWTQSPCQALGSPSLLQMLTDSHDSFHHGSGTSS